MEIFQIGNNIRTSCGLVVDVSGQWRGGLGVPFASAQLWGLDHFIFAFSIEEPWGVRVRVCLWTVGLRLIYVKMIPLKRNALFLLFSEDLSFFFLYSVTMISCQRSPGPLPLEIMIFDSRSLNATVVDWYFKKNKMCLVLWLKKELLTLLLSWYEATCWCVRVFGRVPLWSRTIYPSSKS